MPVSQRASRPEQPLRRPGGSLLTDRERSAGRAQALVLLLASCLPVLGSVLLAPVLPAIQEAFASTPGASALAPIVLTAPALMIGLTAPFAGRVVERTGRKR